MIKRDYYEMLGAGESTNGDETEKVYRELAMKYHPDRNPDSKEAEEKFKETKEVCGMFPDIEKRATYDQYGYTGVDPDMADGFDAGGAGFDRGFAEAFGDVLGDTSGQAQDQGGHRGGDPQIYRGVDLRYSMEITLEQTAHGHDTQIRVPYWDECSHYHGRGAESDSSVETCPMCHSAGQVRISQGFFAMQQTCPKCYGSGKYVPEPCIKRHGQGKLKSQKTLEVKIPVGINEDMRICSLGDGEPGVSGGPSDDLYVEIHVRPHPVLEYDGNDLHCQMLTSFTAAAIGGDIEVPTLGGRASLMVPEGTWAGKMSRLCGKGIRGVRSGYTGDLYVYINAEIPIKLTEHQEELPRQFDKPIHEGGSWHSLQEQSWMDKMKNFFSL